MKTRVVVLSTLLMIFAAASAFAACPAATHVVPADGRLVDFDFVAQSSANAYQFDVTAGHSYVVEVRQDYDQVNTDLTTAVFSDSACTTALTTTATETADPSVSANTFRQSFTVAGTVGTPATYTLTVTNSNASTGRYVSVRVAETTLYSSVYSQGKGSGCPSACFTTYYGILNTTNKALHVTVTLYSSAGAVIGTPANLTIAANGSNVTNTFVLGATAGSTGYALFTHDGPPGALQVGAYIENFGSNPAFTEPVPTVPIREQQF